MVDSAAGGAGLCRQPERTLRRIQLYVAKDPGSEGDYVVQLLRVDGGAPQASALNIRRGPRLPTAPCRTVNRF